MIGMLVAYNDADLLSLQGELDLKGHDVSNGYLDNNTAASSPFVIAIKRAGIRGNDRII